MFIIFKRIALDSDSITVVVTSCGQGGENPAQRSTAQSQMGETLCKPARAASVVCGLPSLRLGYGQGFGGG